MNVNKHATDASN